MDVALVIQLLMMFKQAKCLAKCIQNCCELPFIQQKLMDWKLSHLCYCSKYTCCASRFALKSVAVLLCGFSPVTWDTPPNGSGVQWKGVQCLSWLFLLLYHLSYSSQKRLFTAFNICGKCKAFTVKFSFRSELKMIFLLFGYNNHIMVKDFDMMAWVLKHIF